MVPAYNEGGTIVHYLDTMFDTIDERSEVLVVVDTPTDTTMPHLRRYASRQSRLRPLVNTYGRGPAPAIRYGIEHAQAPVVVVSMADGSDELAKVDAMVELVEGGAAVGAASRYVRGGRQIGGPRVKRLLSRTAGWLLWTFARIGTHDPTNAFKAYSRQFVLEAGIESTRGFEMALEMCAKARRMGLEVGEVPATWRDRTEGKSNFRLGQWLPHYLRWFFYAFGRKRGDTR